MLTPERTLAFMHIPKSAGTSIRAAIAEATGQPVARYGIDIHHLGRICRPDLIAPECAVVLHSDQLRGETGFLSGHFSLSTLLGGWPGAEYITVLREPVSRIL